MNQHYVPSKAFSQVASIRKSLFKIGGLLFSDELGGKVLSGLIAEYGKKFRNRVFPLAVTLAVFVTQVMSDDDSCRQAVARLNADRIRQGLSPASALTGSFCKARTRLPEDLLHDLLTGCAILEESIPIGWLWKDRTVKIVDGSTLLMADTPANQRQYPQPDSQASGVGFPIVRIVVVISLMTGKILDIAMGPYQGKKTGEHALLRQLLHLFKTGDIALGDSYYDSFFLIAMLRALCVDTVFCVHGSRKTDFRRGERLGKHDHITTWIKPPRPAWMSAEQYFLLPDEMKMRELRVAIDIPGFRAKQITLTTSLLNPTQTRPKELGDLYRQRWYAELDLRSIKSTMEMDFLKGKTPAMVRKEIYAHLLAYNLIRKIIFDAARRCGRSPRQLSFKGCLQTINAYQPVWKTTCHVEALDVLYGQLLDAVSQHIVGNRPNRIEPRVRKRRPKSFPWMKKARHLYRKPLYGTQA